MQLSANSRLGFSNQRRGLRTVPLVAISTIYADVAIDIPARDLGDRLFTYHVPPHLQNEIFVGSQVLVPFGHQEMVPGFVINLKDSLQDKPSAVEGSVFKTKAVADVLEAEPLFDREYIAFLYWIADYYAASISDVIAAAIPADIGQRAKRVARLVPVAEGGIDRTQGLIGDAAQVVSALKSAKGNALAVRVLKQRSKLSSAKFYSALATLRHDGIIQVEQESAAGTTAKVVGAVQWTGAAGNSPRHDQIIAAIKRAGGQMPVAALIEESKTTAATIKRMCEQGILVHVKEEVIRDPLSNLLSTVEVKPEHEWPPLTEHQQDVCKALSKALQQRLLDNERLRLEASGAPSLVAASGSSIEESEADFWLVHGVTGSGKTEIYLRLISETIRADKTAIMLVPEISLTPQLARRLVERFGSQVAVWHSALSLGERYDTWRRLKSGDAKVLLGARSAILANMPRLGLIILDEEHDGSYKQSSPSPRYNARTLAMERAAKTGALVVLGSATPDAAIYHEALSKNRILELPERVFKQALPHSTIVDMRIEFTSGNKSIFSERLKEGIAQRLAKQEQVILLINRRGYASHVLCRACGYVARCHNCSVSLVYHQTPPTGVYIRQRSQNGYLVCHHCAFSTEGSETCPSCKSPFVKQFGLGTQKVEEEARQLFPEARLLRIDSDITTRKGAYEEIFGKFSAGEADILIGTQMVAKGLDIAKVTLVGVLAADSAFNLPDYRSFERGFQLLTQVSGRAGRGDYPGEVVLQSYNVDLPALRLSKKQDYLTFVKQEIESRREFEYPPFSQIIRVVISSPYEDLAQSASEQLAEELSTYLEEKFGPDEIKILGPAPCVIERLRGRYRFHLIIKNLAGAVGRKSVTDFLKQKRGHESLSMAVDVDALDLI